MDMTFTDEETFTPSEAASVINEYVCATCHGDLEVFELPGSERVIVSCHIHGSVCDVGRVTKATVSMNAEHSHASRHAFISHLADLYPELADLGMTRDQALRIQHSEFCEVCGGLVDVYAKDAQFTSYRVECRRHPKAGTIARQKYVYDFNRIKAYEKANRKGA